MAASVHLARMLGSEGKPGIFFTGKGIHVRSQGNIRCTLLASFDPSHNTAADPTVLEGDSQPAQFRHNHGGGLFFFKGQLGVAVENPP
jgi:hypothetical protein